MEFKKGDFIKTSKGTVGEILDIDEDDNLEVNFIRPWMSEANGKVYKYDASDEWETIIRNSVVQHVEKPVDKFDYPKVYMELGLKPMGEHKGEEIFIDKDADIEKDEDLKTFQFPTDGFDDDDEANEYEFDGFVVPDEEHEPFTPASPSSEYVQYTHEAVHGYNSWVPDKNDKLQMGIKRTIDSMEKKYGSKEDDRQFAQGKSIDYSHPPLKKVKSNEK
jgi:hypothetical protein